MPLDHGEGEKRAQMFLKTLHPLLFVYSLALPTQPHCPASRKPFSSAEASRSPGCSGARSCRDGAHWADVLYYLDVRLEKVSVRSAKENNCVEQDFVPLPKKKKNVPKQADSCKWLERNRPPLYPSCPFLSPSPASLCCPLVSHSGWSQRKGKINM